MVVRTLQVSGVRGEITPFMHARVDTEFYQAGVAEARNMVVTRYGGFTRAPGTIFDGYAKRDARPVRMLPFEFNEEQIYMIEAGDEYFRFWTPEGQVISSGSPYEIVTPYKDADLPFLHGKQVGDVLYLFCAGRRRPFKLTRLGGTNWTLTPYLPKDGPYLPINTTATTLTPASRARGFPLMTSNSTPSGTVTSTGGGANTFLLLDGDKTTDVQLAPGSAGIVKYDFGAGNAKVLDNYFLVSSKSNAPGNADNMFSAWAFQGSNDDVNWTTLDSRTNESGWLRSEYRYYECNNEVAFRYYRLDFSGGGGDDAIGSIAAEWVPHERAENQTPFDLTASSVAGINNGAGFSADDVDRSIRLQGSDGLWRWAVVTSYVSPTVVKIRLYGQALPSDDAILSWRLGAWSDASGWPFTGRLFEDRLTLAGASSDPIGVWLSVSGGYDSFRTSTPPVDDDALSLRLTGGKLNAIQWLAESGTLLAGTADVLRTVGGRDNGSALSPTNIRQRAETSVGASRIEPVEVENVVLFMDRYAKRLYEGGYSYEADGYLAREVSTLNEHLFRVGVEQIVFFEYPFRYCLCRRTDGAIIFFAYDREQKIVGGTLVDYGAVRDIMVMPGRNGFDVWIVVDRNGRTLFERVAPFFPVDEKVDGALLVPVNSLCSSVYEVPTPTSVFNVPTVLEGAVLGVWADGRDLGDATVTGGEITLPFGKTATQVVLGLRMSWKLKTLRIATYGQQDGSGLGRKARIVEAFVDLLNSAGVEGGTPSDIQPVIDEASAEYDPDDPQPLLTGMYPIHADDSFLNRGVFVMSGDRMYPVTIRGFSLAVEGEP